MTINISVIFNYLRTKGPAYRAQIAKDLGISAPAVSRAIEQLVDNGYVKENGSVKTSSGKTATLFSINLEKGAVIGIDVPSDRIRFGIFNFNGELIERQIGKPLTESEDIEHELIRECSDFVATIQEKRREGRTIPDFEAICIGVPAVVDVEDGQVVSAVLYESLTDLNLKKLLSETFGVATYVENIVNLCALGEKCFGRGSNYKNLVFIYIGNGIGAGIIVDNNLMRGSLGAAGEIGYSVFSMNDLDKQMSPKGFLEKYASVEMFREKAVEELEGGRESLLSGWTSGNMKKVTSALVFAAAIAGDPLAKEIIAQSVEYITLSVINIILLLNPEIVVFGGDICGFDGVEEHFIEPINRKIRSYLPFDPPEIGLSELGVDAGLQGASVMAVETLLTGKYPYRLEL
jgi:predicted NBD/HSP70 family sugar kinase